MQKNATKMPPIEVLTGLHQGDTPGEIIAVNGKSKLDWWSGKCNELKGSTNGYFLPKNVKKSDTIYFYIRDLCHAMPFEYQKEIVNENGIPGLRYVPSSNAFGTPQENPDNACYCDNPVGNCNTPSGVFNNSACQFDGPVLISWPHLFQADPKLLERVEGLDPVAEKHQSFMDIQPVSFFFKSR